MTLSANSVLSEYPSVCPRIRYVHIGGIALGNTPNANENLLPPDQLLLLLEVQLVHLFKQPPPEKATQPASEVVPVI